MLTIRKVILPVDYSDCSRAAIPFVKELVQRYGAELTLVHAYGPEAFPTHDAGLTYGEMIDRVESREHLRLDNFAQESFPELDIKTTAQLADAAALIENIVESQRADLVMLPTHGRGPLRRMLVGSVAAKVLHDLPVPMWTATPEALRRNRIPYRSVLCACDINDISEALPVVQAAAAIASKYNANLSLLHIIEMPPFATEISYADFRGALIDAANTRLQELKASAGIIVPHRVSEGPISTVIQQEASLRDVDLIVTGRGHQQGSVSRLWSGLYRIVRDSHCPVLSV
jgi:nucleotide-binding universal stress UspA family protein